MAQRDQILDSVAINGWLALLRHLSLCPRWTVTACLGFLGLGFLFLGLKISGGYYFGYSRSDYPVIVLFMVHSLSCTISFEVSVQR